MIKKFFVENKTISVIAIIAILICISYCATYYLPDNFGLEPLYALVDGLCISYLAATIFYIVQVYVPYVRKKTIMLQAVMPLFKEIYIMLALTVACYEKYVSFDQDGKVHINWDNSSIECIYFKYSIQGAESSSLCKKTRVEICTLSNLFKSKIEYIKKSAYCGYFSSEIIELINSLDEFKGYKHYIPVLIHFSDSFIKFDITDDFTKELYNLIKKIDSIFQFNQQYVLLEIDTMEKAILDAKEMLPSQIKTLDQLNTFVSRTVIEDKVKTIFKENNINIRENEFANLMKDIFNSPNAQKN